MSFEQSELEQAIANYQAILITVEENQNRLSLQQILDVLLARDRVEVFLTRRTNPSGKNLAELVELDRRLRKLASVITEHNRLAHCCQTFNPPETSWWWFLKPPVPTTVLKWMRFDWLWNTLTVACLVGTGSFATNTIQAFSQNGMDLLQTFGTISQGAGLILVSGGALTDKGKKTVKTMLTSLKIAPQYQAEATLGFSAIVLLSSYGIYNSLPVLGEYYYRKGNKFYNNGELAQAKLNYEEAANFKPSDPDIRVALGNVYETVEQYDLAKQQYQLGLFEGDPASLNGLGRTFVRTAQTPQDLVKAEINFRLALSQKSLEKLENITLKAELHTNLGFVLLKQAENQELPLAKVNLLRNEAEHSFRTAIVLEEQIPKKSDPGLGMSHCYLAVILQEKGNGLEAIESWQACEKDAFPASAGQYEDIIQYGGPKLASKIDTSGIIREDESLILEDKEEEEQEKS